MRMQNLTIEGFELQNNLTTIIASAQNLPTKSKNQLYSSMVIRTGSLADQNISGIAHFTEHMLLTMGRISKPVQDSVKYQLVGTTGFDRTKYILRYKSQFIEHGINLFKEIICGKYLNSDFLEATREDIIKEYQFKMSSNEVKMITLLLKDTNLFEYSPIGKLENIRNISYEMILKFFNDNYIFKDECIILLTDLDSDIVLEKICLAFHTTISKKLNILADISGMPFERSIYPKLSQHERIKVQSIQNLPNNEFHIYIRSCINIYSLKDLISESIILTLAEEGINVSFQGVKGTISTINQFSNNYRYMHIVITFIDKCTWQKMNYNNLINFLIKWMNMCEDEDLIQKVKCEYKKNFEKTNLNPFEILHSLEDSFIYKRRIFFSNYEMKDSVDPINVSDISNLLKNSLLNDIIFTFLSDKSNFYRGEISHENKKWNP